MALLRCKNLQLTSQVQHSAVSGFDNVTPVIGEGKDQSVISRSIDRLSFTSMDQSMMGRSVDQWISGSMDLIEPTNS